MLQVIQRDQVVPGATRVVLVPLPGDGYDTREAADSPFRVALSGAGLNQDEVAYVLRSVDKDTHWAYVPSVLEPVALILIDMSQSQEARMERIRLSAVPVLKGVNLRKEASISVQDQTGTPMHVYALLEGLFLANYQFIRYKSGQDSQKHTLREIVLQGALISEPLLHRLRSVMKAVYLVRDLVNEPSSYLTARCMARHFSEMGAEAGFNVEVLEKQQISELGMGGLLAVNQGSTEPPVFSVLTWKPHNARNQQPVVLVGKGLVFDTGGLCLKPTASMDEMKSDMSGGAAVAGVLYALALTQSPVYVIGLVPSTDNRISATAFTPGDIITMHDGTTVEMVNSDAEGRLILADALSYARKFDPLLAVDIATLTGSATMAIGNIGVVAMGNASREWMDGLRQSGEQTYERIAEFPFWDEYAAWNKSHIADIKNSGKRSAGAITAGKFLEHFTDYPYIHLDIAGPAYLDEPDGYRVRGGTGVGVRLLYDFIHRII